jgi:exopolyphosphatase/guanosine-5'-triphosphate,3'-diphosphate pyrophosphatase
VAELRGSDLIQVEAQLGRKLLSPFTVVARCSLGHPLVIRNHPLDHAGKPFPTLYWLTCPQAVKAVSRLESEGWIQRLAERSSVQAALADIRREYAAERGRLLPGSEDWGGVGGARAGIKCLHAHYAYHLAGGEDILGAWVARRVEPVHPERSGEAVAAIDVGTNSVRLLVAHPTHADLVELSRDMIITRLGQGVDRTKRLDPEALQRTLDVLQRFVRRASALGAVRIRVAATSAVRDASNREELFEVVTTLAGAPPEVLTGEHEASLSFLGATRGLDHPSPFLVFDIGGGSTELVLGTDQPEAAVSVDTGSVRITERVGPADPPSGEDIRAMSELAAEALASAERVVPPTRAATLVGVAGTTTTIQAIALGLPFYDPEAIHRTVLSLAEAERVAADLARMTVSERAALPVMAPGREDVIVAGSLILLEIFRRWGFKECVVSERDLLDGLVIEMLAADGFPLPWRADGE